MLPFFMDKRTMRQKQYDKEKIREAYIQGMSIPDISKSNIAVDIYGNKLSISTIRQTVKDLVDKYSKRSYDIDREYLYDLYWKEGLSVVEIHSMDACICKRTKQRISLSALSDVVKATSKRNIDEDTIRDLYFNQLNSIDYIHGQDCCICKDRNKRVCKQYIINNVIGKENMRKIGENRRKLINADELIKMYVEDKLPLSVIEKKLGTIHKDTIRKILIENNIEIFTQSSCHEIIIRDYLESKNIEYIHNTRHLLGNRELDIVIPSYALAIEVNGVYWHSNKTRDYHLDKFKRSKNKGYMLYQFTDADIECRLDFVKYIIDCFFTKKPYNVEYELYRDGLLLKPSNNGFSIDSLKGKCPLYLPTDYLPYGYDYRQLDDTIMKNEYIFRNNKYEIYNSGLSVIV